VQLPVTHSNITSEFGFITLENYSLSPAIQILRQIITQTLSEMYDVPKIMRLNNAPLTISWFAEKTQKKTPTLQ